MPPSIRSRDLYRSRVEKAVAFIGQNLAQPLDLEQLAAVSGFSPYHFHRIFTAILDETPQDFVNRLRVERAANLLVKSPALSITEIALSCGFSSSSTFARSFKKHFGLPAREYARTQQPPDTPGIAAVRETPHNVPLQVEVRPMPALHLAFVASLHGYAPVHLGRAWKKIFEWAYARRLVTPTTRVVGISYDDPLITPPNRCRYYASLTVPETLTGDPLVGILDIPAGACAVLHLEGPSEQIQPAYRALYYHWLPDSGYQPADAPCYEIFLDAPDIHPGHPYVLDICLPVTPL